VKNIATCLQMDVGNSGAKWRAVKAGKVVARGKYRSGDDASRDDLYAGVDAPEQIWISSVASEAADAELTELLMEQWAVTPWFAKTQSRTCGLVNSYAEPERMGVDRWLAMLAARQVFSGRLCVVDAGSALTIDIVDEHGQHEGGYIIPGPALMERALLLDTDRVRFDTSAGYELSPGKSTAEAVRHGIALSQAGSVRMAQAKLNLSDDQLVFCGGGGEALHSLLGEAGALVPDLVFDGLELMASSHGL
jgi:type III pantothenate kinase